MEKDLSKIACDALLCIADALPRERAQPEVVTAKVREIFDGKTPVKITEATDVPPGDGTGAGFASRGPDIEMESIYAAPTEEFILQQRRRTCHPAATRRAG